MRISGSLAERSTAGSGQEPVDFVLAPDIPFVLSGARRITLVRAALERNPDSAALREQLAHLLFANDDFDDAIALFEELTDARSGAAFHLTLADAYLCRRSLGDDGLAEAAAHRALASATDDRARAEALAALGKSLIRQDRRDEARAVLAEALDANPRHVDAYKRLAATTGDKGALAVLALADALIGRGIAHAQLLATRANALAVVNRVNEARAVIGLDRFLDRRIVGAPTGWPTLMAFNNALADELADHPDVRYDRYGAASTMTWRVERPLTAHSVAFVALQDAIREAVHDYVERMADDDVSPWLHARPAAASLHLSCVITEADGFENWHVHQHGWLSGVYYIDVPPGVTAGDGREGCIAFGLPNELVGADAAAAYGERIIRPEPGLLLLFPSHAYHRTFAHGSDHRRICVAFDVGPS